MKVSELVGMLTHNQEIKIERKSNVLFEDEVRRVNAHPFGDELNKMVVSKLFIKDNVLTAKIKESEGYDYE